VLLVVADDLGWADVPGFGDDPLPAPALERLAREGLCFTTAYAAASVCSPARAALLSGRYPQRFGHENNTGSLERQRREGIGLPIGVATLAERLRARGYATGAIGKWHLGANDPFHPLARGFDEFFGFLGGGHDYFDWSDPERGPLLRGREPAEGEGYLTDAFAGEARDFLGRHAQRPFFLYLAFNAVHPPLQPPAAAEAPGVELDARARYGAMFAALDRALGSVLGELDRLGIAERTLVVFLGDNGGAEENGASNGPFRAGKRSPYEGGLRIPLVVRWPAGARAGSTCPEPVSVLDVAPTVLALAGSTPGAAPVLDGLDLASLADSAPPPARALFWRQGNAWAVREGRYKLVARGRRAAELYDLEVDPGEATDLAAERPEVVERLRAALAEWERGLVPPLWEWRDDE